MAYMREREGRAKARALIARTGHGPIGGHFKKGGDATADKKLIDSQVRKALHQHENAEHGGKHERITLRDGGRAEGKKGTARADRSARGKRAHRDMGGAMPMPQNGQAPGAMPPPMPNRTMPPVEGGSNRPPMQANPMAPGMGGSPPMRPPMQNGAAPGVMKKGGKATRAHHAEGGRAKGKGGKPHTKINIVVANPGAGGGAEHPPMAGDPPMGGAPMAAPPPKPPMPAALPPPPPGGPPMGAAAPMPPKPPMAPMPGGPPPGGMPPGAMMRKAGGRAGRPHMTAGSLSGEGRLEKVKALDY